MSSESQDAQEPELVTTLSDNHVALLDRLLQKLNKLYEGHCPKLAKTLEKLRKKVYVEGDGGAASVDKVRSMRRAIVEAWDVQTKAHYERFATADASSAEMDDVFAKMCETNYFLKAIDMADKWKHPSFAPSKAVVVKNLRIMNVLACLLDLFSGEIERVLIEIGSRFTEIFEGGGKMTSDDLQKFVHTLGQSLNMDNMIKIQKVVKKVILMLGGVDAFEEMIEKVLGRNQLLSKIIRALLQSERTGKDTDSSGSLLSTLNSKFGSAVGVHVQERDKGGDKSDDDDDEEDDEEDDGDGDGGGGAASANPGVSTAHIHVTRDDMERTFANMREEMSRFTGPKDSDSVISALERAYQGDDGAYSSIVAAAAMAAQEGGMALSREDFEEAARKGAEMINTTASAVGTEAGDGAAVRAGDGAGAGSAAK